MGGPGPWLQITCFADTNTAWLRWQLQASEAGPPLGKFLDPHLENIVFTYPGMEIVQPETNVNISINGSMYIEKIVLIQSSLFVFLKRRINIKVRTLKKLQIWKFETFTPMREIFALLRRRLSCLMLNITFRHCQHSTRY